MKIELERYEAILFDFGGVIIDIDEEIMIEAFNQLGAIDVTENEEVWNNMLFLMQQFEISAISTNEFCIELSQLLEIDASYGEIIETWNKMILDIPSERLDILNNLSKKLPLYLCSNTNPLHMAHIYQLRGKRYKEGPLFDYFIKEYYSYEIGLRKPDRRFYNYIIENSNINSIKTLFIDDNLANIKAAEKLGFGTLHLSTDRTLEEIFQQHLV